MRLLGANESVAAKVAANSRRWWRNSGMLHYSELTIAYYNHNRIGLSRLS